ncbi:MAG: DUF3800 domain-containing protein [Armatimonadetes bacterium]|nr:DUF3800 domain-containing protein [Armatimonadota bacterium]
MEQVNYCVDEAGDSVLFARRGELTVGRPGCSRFFIMGLARIGDLTALEADCSALRETLMSDPYFRDVPSMQADERKTALCFHAKDDLPEVRREVLQVLLKHDVSFSAVVRDKVKAAEIVSDFRRINPHYAYKQEHLYDDLVRRLLRDKLHNDSSYAIIFARRGKPDRTKALQSALEKGHQQWCASCGIKHDPPPDVSVTTQYPHENAGLQAVDYFLWALQRCYERREDRFIRLVWSKVESIWDCDCGGADDPKGIYYTKEKPLEAAKLGI